MSIFASAACAPLQVTVTVTHVFTRLAGGKGAAGAHYAKSMLVVVCSFGSGVKCSGGELMQGTSKRVRLPCP